MPSVVTILAALVEKRGSVVKKLQEFDQALEPILDILTDSEVAQQLESNSGKWVRNTVAHEGVVVPDSQ